MKNLNKKYLILGISFLLICGSIFFVFNKFNKKKFDKENKTKVPTEVVIPTVDSSVLVNLTSTIAGKEVLLSIKNIPSGTSSIDYELSYQTTKQGLQGVIGTINLENNQKNYEKKITLGTCSSGSCVYHQVVGEIKLNLKFIGNYGERIFEKEFLL